MEGELRQLQELGKRGNLEIAFDKQVAAGGGFDQLFLLHKITNSYANLTNLALRIAPANAKRDAPAVLISAHFDSISASVGASDCAACVATALEIARAVVADGARELRRPLIVLLNGGEEVRVRETELPLNSWNRARLSGCVPRKARALWCGRSAGHRTRRARANILR